MLDGRTALPCERARAVTDHCLQGLVGHERIDKRAVQRFRHAAKSRQFDTALRFGLLKVNHRGLFHAEPFRQLRARHAKRLADGLDPAAHRGRKALNRAHLPEAFVKARARLGGKA